MTKPATTKVTIVNRLGLHTRAAAQFVKLATQFKSQVKVVRGRETADGKSIMGILMLAAGQGTSVNLEVSGPDQDEALKKLKALVEDGFGEDK